MRDGGLGEGLEATELGVEGGFGPEGDEGLEVGEADGCAELVGLH